MAENYQITQLQSDSTLKVLHPETNAGVVQETTDKKVFTATERTKLAGIESGAEVNIINEVKVNGSALTPDSNGSVNVVTTDDTKIPLSQKGAANGVATLDGSGLVPSSQLPSYVDDIIDAYVVGSTPFASNWLSTTSGGSPLTPVSGKIYVIVSAGAYINREYRWSGTVYAEVSPSLALGETSSTAYAGDKGKANADNISAILGGTKKVGNADQLDGQDGSYYLNYNNFTNTPTIPDISVTDSGSGGFVKDLSASGHTITATLGGIANSDLPDSGVSAGTYSAVQVNAKGVVTSGGAILEVGAAGQTTPSASLATGGIFYKKL